MDNNTTKRMTLKELVESRMPFTEIVEYVRDRDFVRVSNSDPAKAIVPIQSKDLENELSRSRFTTYKSAGWKKVRELFGDDYDFSKENEENSFFVNELVDGTYGQWGKSIVLIAVSKRHPDDKSQREGYVCNNIHSLKEILKWMH
jgi:hypothetical protein